MGPTRLIEACQNAGPMVHQVHAVREGSSAVLRCDSCLLSRSFDEADFDGINGFVHDHRLCRDASA